MGKALILLIFTLYSSLMFGQTSLQYRLKEGDTFTIRQNAQQVITQELDGATHEITNKINGVIEFKVVGEKEDNYELTITFKDLNLNMISSIQGELLNVHAKEVSEDDIQSRIFNSLLNVPVQITLAKNGDILGVTGGDTLVAKMANSSGLQDEFSLNMMKKSLEKEFGSEALSDSYEQMTYIYPKEEVQVGDTWKNEYTGGLSVKNVWSLEGLTGTYANIIGKADVLMDIAEPATTMKLKGTQQTSVTTDLASGFVQSMTVEGESKGISTITQMGAQEIPTTIKSTITYELIKI